MTVLIAALSGIGVSASIKKLNEKNPNNATELKFVDTIGSIPFLYSPIELYVQAIEETSKKFDVVFIEPIPDVLKLLADKGLKASIVTPNEDSRESHLDSMRKRGLPTDEIDTVNFQWTGTLQLLRDQKHPLPQLKHIELPKDTALDSMISVVVHHAR